MRTTHLRRCRRPLLPLERARRALLGCPPSRLRWSRRDLWRRRRSGSLRKSDGAYLDSTWVLRGLQNLRRIEEEERIAAEEAHKKEEEKQRRKEKEKVIISPVSPMRNIHLFSRPRKNSRGKKVVFSRISNGKKNKLPRSDDRLFSNPAPSSKG